MKIKIPRKFVGWLAPRRYKGAKGGRGSGKSHEVAQRLIERHVQLPDYRSVAIREIQKSMKFSNKQLLENKIKAMGVSHLFEITLNEIRRIDPTGKTQPAGIIIFQGMQDHTADSIKSLEGFDCAWVEEAQKLSKTSLELLRPTIRKDGSEIWFTWNPKNKTDAVDEFMNSGAIDDPDNFLLIHVNYTDNHYLTEVLKMEVAHDIKNMAHEQFAHKWLGQYNENHEALIFRNKYSVQEFKPVSHWQGAYIGLDFGFSNDPTAAVKCWIADNHLYIEHEAGKIGLELDATSEHLKRHIPDIERYTIRADNARPESISYLKRHGLPKVTACKKGKGSVEDGIEFIKSFDKVIIHPRCKNTIHEFGSYSYKVDKLSGDILPDILDENNHWIDAIRYALEPIMKNKGSFGIIEQSMF